MKIRFKASAKRTVYHGDITLLDGQTADVSDAEGKRLLADFPENFSVVDDAPQKVEGKKLRDEEKASRPKKNKMFRSERDK